MAEKPIKIHGFLIVVFKKRFNKKKAIIYDYLTFLKNNFNSNSFNKTALMHIQNIFSGYSGSKKWKFNVSNSIKNRNLNNLLKILDCDSKA